jgi:nucleotide-binding universal stress UspA family protein
MGFDGFMQTGPWQVDSVDGVKAAALQFLDKSRRHLGDETIKILVEEGEYADSILKTAKGMHADVIVMGSHSRKWLENIVMGSVTEKVLHHTLIPLFIIPTKKSNEKGMIDSVQPVESMNWLYNPTAN